MRDDDLAPHLRETAEAWACNGQCDTCPAACFDSNPEHRDYYEYEDDSWADEPDGGGDE